MSNYFLTRGRKNEIKDLVLDILKACDITALPVPIAPILKHYGIGCLKMSQTVSRSSTEPTNEDGAVLRLQQRSVIVYNPQHSRGRIRFTLAVQLAHILLGHMNGMPQNRATDMEAAYFAKELLMPIAVLDHVGARSRQSIARFCDVSQMAAGYRARDFERRDRFRNGYGETEYDIRFLVQLLEGTVERASEN